MQYAYRLHRTVSTCPVYGRRKIQAFMDNKQLNTRSGMDMHRVNIDFIRIEEGTG